MEKQYILVIDEGTTGVRTLIYDKELHEVSRAYRNITTYYPEKAGVEQDPVEIYTKTVDTMREAVERLGISPKQIAGIGITAQRSTWTFWNKDTGEPLRRSVVWSDTRSCYVKNEYIYDDAFNKKFPEVEPQLFFSANHIPVILKWITRNEPEFARELKKDSSLAGTVDTWLIYCLTGGKVHATNLSQASTASFYSMKAQDWNRELGMFSGLGKNALAPICPEAYYYGTLDPVVLGEAIPICANIADQHAALFSQGCLRPKTAKCTMGTGFFFDVNLGNEAIYKRGFLTGFCWEIKEDRPFMFEGFLPVAGSAMEWMKNNLGLIEDFSNMESEALSVEDNGGVYFIPALNSLTSTPFHDPAMEGAFMGITAKTNRRHFIRAVMEGVAFISAHVLLNTIKITGRLEEMRVDGGVTHSDLICQILANVTDTKIIRGKNVEATAKGAAQIAAIQLGWIGMDDIEGMFRKDKVFEPNKDQETDLYHYKWWKKALDRAGNWNDPLETQRGR